VLESTTAPTNPYRVHLLPDELLANVVGVALPSCLQPCSQDVDLIKYATNSVTKTTDLYQAFVGVAVLW